MQLNITFRHLEPSDALKVHVRDRVEHVQKYIDRPSEAHAVLHVENLDHHAEITVKAGRFLLRGCAKTQDMYASIDAAAEKIEKQLKKHKSKLNTFKANGNHAEHPPLDVRHDILDILEHPDRPSHRVVKSTKFQAKPMSRGRGAAAARPPRRELLRLPERRTTAPSTWSTGATTGTSASSRPGPDGSVARGRRAGGAT